MKKLEIEQLEKEIKLEKEKLAKLENKKLNLVLDDFKKSKDCDREKLLEKIDYDETCVIEHNGIELAKITISNDDWFENPFEEWSMLGSLVIDKKNNINFDDIVSENEKVYIYDVPTFNRIMLMKGDYIDNEEDKEKYRENISIDYDIEDIFSINSYEDYLTSKKVKYKRFKIGDNTYTLTGYIYVSEEKIINEYGDLSDKTLEQVNSVLKGEIVTLRKYINNECYSYAIESKLINNEFNNCSGFLTIEEASYSAIEEFLGNL